MSLVGMVGAFAERIIIDGVLGFGPLLVLMTYYIIGHFAVTRAPSRGARSTVGIAALAGFSSAAMVAALILLLKALPAMGSVLINATPSLLIMLTFGQDVIGGSLLVLLLGASIGALAGMVQLLPRTLQRSVIGAAVWVVLIGLLQELLRVTFQNYELLTAFLSVLFAANGLTAGGALGLFIVIFAIMALWMSYGRQVQSRFQRLPSTQRRVFVWSSAALAFLVLLVLPLLLGLFFSELLVNVGIFILLGLGLNIVVGFAGLLDLGYVAFFAIGAYTIGVLTSPEVPFQLDLSFWAALPLAVGVAVIAGICLGIPVLKIRGDYLAIVTLGFGEIIRLLANSDLLKPWLGDGLGLHAIPKPFIVDLGLNPLELVDSPRLYYLVLAGCLLILFVSIRLKSSRLGRAWMAIREDEDVAQAMGINLVATKLLAFAMGAAFAGIGGAINATKVTTIYPASFNILISINVLALIIMGGMGSIPGVVVGALVLVGLPELFREFADYRLLLYGAVLVLMMQLRPEGLLPSALSKRELHESLGEPPVRVADPMPAATD